MEYNSLAQTQRVKKFPTQGHLNFMKWKEDAIPKHMHFDKHQEWFQHPLSKVTPIDTSQAIFHGETDGELVSMDIE